MGAEVAMYFTKQVSPKPAYLNIGPSISQIFFYDPKIKTIEYSEPYKEKSLASAFCLNARLSVGTFSTFASGKIFTYYGQVKFGAAYVQNSFYFVDTHRGLNLTSWNTVFGIGVGFWYYNPRWWLPSIGLGIQYANLGGKHLQGFMLN
ncbi:MAG: hypothetical protein K0S32_4183 [Bacteroidetes bacterium]|nr:hypothetical protein [Bacteroidota bacterium]